MDFCPGIRHPGSCWDFDQHIYEGADFKYYSRDDKMMFTDRLWSHSIYSYIVWYLKNIHRPRNRLNTSSRVMLRFWSTHLWRCWPQILLERWQNDVHRPSMVSLNLFLHSWIPLDVKQTSQSFKYIIQGHVEILINTSMKVLTSNITREMTKWCSPTVFGLTQSILT